MKNKSILLKAVGVLLFVLAVYSIAQSSLFWKVPENITGDWNGTQPVKVRSQNEQGKYKFTQSPAALPLTLHVDAAGRVTGRLGDATFANCKIRKNRGWMGKKLNLATDYVIRGELEGKTFPNDPSDHKKITIPFNVENGRTSGTIFELVSWDLYPLADAGIAKAP